MLTRTVEDLKSTFPRAGRLEWIGLSPARRAELVEVDCAQVEIGTGLVGDHHSLSGRGERQVTLIQAEHLPAIGALLGAAAVSPFVTRRNLVVSGMNLTALKDRTFRIGDVTLAGTGPCDPCSRMEENLGPGGYNAMRGMGGITARVVAPGEIRLGDPVEVVADKLEPNPRP